MRILVLGAGAIGSSYGWHLAKAGNEVTLVDIWREHVQAIERDGLVRETPAGDAEAVRVRAIADGASAPEVELVICAVKSFATAEAARSIVGAVGPDALVATVQNGLGNDRALASVFGAERVLPGSTTVGGVMLGPARVRVTPSTASGESLTSLGKPRTADAELGEIERTLNEAGLPTEVLDDVDVIVWRKLAMAGSMGPLSAVLRWTTADVVENEATLGLLRRLYEEIVAVARATGVDLDLETTWQHGLAVYRGVGPHHASTCVDVLEGRRTEIEAMCLEVARLGREHGVETPVNRVVGELVRAVDLAAR